MNSLDTLAQIRNNIRQKESFYVVEQFDFPEWMYELGYGYDFVEGKYIYPEPEVKMDRIGDSINDGSEGEII